MSQADDRHMGRQSIFWSLFICGRLRRRRWRTTWTGSNWCTDCHIRLSVCRATIFIHCSMWVVQRYAFVISRTHGHAGHPCRCPYTSYTLHDLSLYQDGGGDSHIHSVGSVEYLRHQVLGGSRRISPAWLIEVENPL